MHFGTMIKIKKSSFFFYQSAHLSAFCLQICHILAGLNSSLLPACRRLAQALYLQQTFAFVLLHTQQSCCIAYMQPAAHMSICTSSSASMLHCRYQWTTLMLTCLGGGCGEAASSPQTTPCMPSSHKPSPCLLRLTIRTW